jgi:cytochrome c peroxidase
MRFWQLVPFDEATDGSRLHFNTATISSYFHDGSAPTLNLAARQMGFAQLNSTLTDSQVDSIVAFQRTPTGLLRDRPVGEPP